MCIRTVERRVRRILCVLLCYTSVTPLASDQRVTDRQSVESPFALPPVVYADGEGLPDGTGDAMRGALVYAERCGTCHGTRGQGGRALELVGEHESLDGEWPDHGIAARWPFLPPLFDYVQRAMPPQAPGSLDDATTWDLLAHLLVLNGLHEPTVPLDTQRLLAIRMPNRAGFVDARIR